MTEFCFQNNKKKKKFCNFSVFFSFILSHPLYFSYLIFFSPYLIKLLSFLCPLFFTTFLLILSLLTTLIPLKSITNSNEGLLLTAYNTLLENSQPEFEDESGKSTPITPIEELVYKVVFDVPTVEANPVENEQIQANPVEYEQIQANPVANEQIQASPVEIEKIQANPVENVQILGNPVEMVQIQANPVEKVQVLANPVEKEQVQANPVENVQVQANPVENVQIVGNTVQIKRIPQTPVEIEKIQEDPVEFFEVKGTGDECETLTFDEEKVGTKPKKVKKEGLKKIGSRKGSEAIKSSKSESIKLENDKNFSGTFSQTLGGQPNMGSFGSMRKEKEWRRTLACKLFEERHNGSNTNLAINGGISGEEGMDLLWETYETELLHKVKVKPNNKLEEVSKKGKKKEEKIEDLMVNNEEEDEYLDDNGKFCCLQALKLSAGKMNLSMGMKISKAIKGIGLLQNHVKKQGKKGYK